MSNWPAVLAIAIPLVQGTCEWVAMRQTGTAARRRQPEWTFFAVNIPYWLLVPIGLPEHYWRPTLPSLAAIAIGATIAIVGTAIRVACHYQLAGAFSPYVEITPQQHLIDSGMYRYVRHPMYAGSLLLFIGLPLLLASPLAASLSIVATAALGIRIAKEERFLLQHLPGYRDYAQRTWRLMPGV